MNKIQVRMPSRYVGRVAIVYDIDNTLLDVSERLVRSIIEAGGDPIYGLSKMPLDRRRRFWSIFLSSKYIHLDKPDLKAIEDVNRKYDSGYIIILLTGRPEYMRKDTVKQLETYSVKYHILIMRPNNNRDPDYIYKPMVIEALIQKGINIVEYHEDDIKTIKKISKLFPTIKVYRHNASKSDISKLF